MMNNKMNVNVRGSVEFSVDSKILESIRKVNTWFTNGKVSWVLVLIAAVTDIGGFISIYMAHLNADENLIPIIILGLSVAFEAAPLYIGYSICLYAYEFGERIRKWVLIFSSTSFVMGIIANTAFRIIDIKETAGTAIVMILLPIITSFMNLAIGCLSFDPLGMDMLRLSKLLRKLKFNLYKYNLIVKELENDATSQIEAQNKENSDYSNARIAIFASSIKMKSYVDLMASNFNLK